MLDQIKTENLDSILSDLSSGQNKFNDEIFKVLLENSCYYPASDTDATPIKYLENIQSFISCDYIYDEDEWTNEISKEMDGYELVYKEKLNVTKFFNKHFLLKSCKELSCLIEILKQSYLESTFSKNRCRPYQSVRFSCKDYL
jgi:hypothetical protein